MLERIRRFFAVRPYCPVCKAQPAAFLPLPDYYQEHWRQYKFPYGNSCEMTPLDTYSCVSCGASDRERLYALWIRQQIKRGVFSRGSRLIHFAPEAALAGLLRSMNVFDYVSADLSMPTAGYRVDITALPFADESFDFFICSHVLEHVDDDNEAISELYRILKTGGRGILMAPIVTGLAETLEDTEIQDVAERWRLFGQDDHVRIYAHDDYVARIQSRGFALAQLGEAYFGARRFQTLGLKSSTILYIATKH